MRLLRACDVGAKIEEGATTIWFAKGAPADRDYVVLQYDPEPDAQDVALGMVGLYIEVNDQGHSAYDASTVDAIGPSHILLSLNAARLGLDKAWSRLRIEVSVEDMEAIIPSLIEIQAGAGSRGHGQV